MKLDLQPQKEMILKTELDRLFLILVSIFRKDELISGTGTLFNAALIAEQQPASIAKCCNVTLFAVSIIKTDALFCSSCHEYFLHIIKF